MKYLDATPNSSGAYPNIKLQPFDGCIPITEEQAEIVLKYNGFITITSSNNEYIVEPNESALNNWKIISFTEESKEQKIKQSKIDLSNYLETHPIQWTDGEYYSITAEKQQQLTSKIMVATMAQTLSQPYDLTWNSTGEVCKEWTISDLSALAFAIDQRVTALVSYQQTQEVAMRNATTQEELNSIIVDYDSVSVTNEKTK